MLIGIFTSARSQAPMETHERIEAIANAGLSGDRYATGQGFYSGMKEWDAHVSLIESEPFTNLKAQHGVTLDPRELRRNLLTRGVDLASLIGRKFRIGKAIFQGRKAWPPCAHIVKFSGRVEIFKYLAKQCGIGADILQGGEIRVGDPILLLPA